LLAIEDITERKRMERELERRVADQTVALEQQRVNQMKGESAG
jgi:hypothetical protein